MGTDSTEDFKSDDDNKEYVSKLEDHIINLNTELFFIHEKCQMLLNALETEQKTSQMLNKLVDKIRAQQKRLERKHQKKTCKKKSTAA